MNLQAMKPGKWTPIATQGRDMTWHPHEPGSIEAARAAYDDGVIEMAQRRDGDCFVLLACRRVVTAKRAAWFLRAPSW